ncbi:MAG: glycosyltransferase, partial [Myxococcaceae bacterium]
KCVESVVAHARGDWRLILVHDASPLPEMKPLMQKLAALDKRIVVAENETNQGFVITANRGMRMAEGRDVLLLNSDTEVFEGFLERLQKCAYVDEQTGILTPFSNNATLCSIPNIGQDNPIPDGYTPASWAALVTACSHKLRPEIVTGVGFCMYVKAEVFAKIGYFDEVSYGRGFGEENDFCERAKKANYKIRLCDDVFVYHKGKASFGDEGRALESTNGEILESKHPGYHAAVQQFFAFAPLTVLHDEIKLHMRRSRSGAENALLFIVHASPWLVNAGGTEYHVKDLVRALRLPRALIAYPSGSHLVVAEIYEGDVDNPTLFRFPLRTPTSLFCIAHEEMSGLLKHWISLFGISGVHVHHALFWPPGMGHILEEAGVPYVYTGHDYYCVNPSWNLFDIDKRQRCDCSVEDSTCVGPWITWLDLQLPWTVVDFRQEHRNAFNTLLGKARALVFPSESAKKIVLGHFPDLAPKAQVIEHGHDGRLTRERAPPGAQLRVAALGEISHPIKGAKNYLELVKASVGLPIEWHFYGGTQAFGFDEQLKALPAGHAFNFHGRYTREDISNLLAGDGIDVCVMLPEVDETFSFVLSEAAIAGVPSLVLERGSLPNRVQRDGLGWVVKDVSEAIAKLTSFAEDRSRLSDATASTRRFRHPSVQDNAEAYRALYTRLEMLRAPPEVPFYSTKHMHELVAVRERPVALPHGGGPAAAPPKYQSSLWYPAFRRVKPLIPDQVRELGRRVLTRGQRKVFRINKLQLNENAMRDVEVRKRGLTTHLFESTSSDPQFVFSATALDPGRVRAVRFRLRHHSSGRPTAQIFWTHSEEEGFKETKSASVSLESPAGTWGDYVVNLDSPTVYPVWMGKGQLFYLRFDPLDAPGSFEVSDLEFFS